MRKILSGTEVARNKRLKELFNERQNKTTSLTAPRTTLTYEELDKVKELVKQGMTRDEAVKQVLNKL
jgi:hypothetical protein